MAPPAVIFSRIRATVFSIATGYPSKGARDTWNWLTNVYTVGVGSICEKAIGELTIVTAAKIRPTATPIHRLFMHLSPWAGLSAPHGNTLEGRSPSPSRNFADGEARRRSV